MTSSWPRSLPIEGGSGPPGCQAPAAGPTGVFGPAGGRTLARVPLRVRWHVSQSHNALPIKDLPRIHLQESVAMCCRNATVWCCRCLGSRTSQRTTRVRPIFRPSFDPPRLQQTIPVGAIPAEASTCGHRRPIRSAHSTHRRIGTRAAAETQHISAGRLARCPDRFQGARRRHSFRRPTRAAVIGAREQPQAGDHDPSMDGRVPRELVNSRAQPKPIGRAASDGLAEVRAYWERYADRVLARAGGLSLREHFARLANDHQQAYGSANRLLLRIGIADKHVLELGFGMGFDTISFLQAGAHLVSIDLSQKCLEVARQHLACYGLEADLRVGNAERLDFAPESFDVVTARGILQFTPDPTAALKEISRVLRPGGTVQALLHNKHSWYVALARLARANLVDPVQDPQHNRLYTRREVRALFRDFSDVRVYTDRLPTMGSKRPGLASKLYNAVVVAGAKRVPRRILEPVGFYLIVQATKPLNEEAASWRSQNMRSV